MLLHPAAGCTGCETKGISEFQWKMLLTTQHSAHPDSLRRTPMGNHRLLLSAYSKNLLPPNNSELELMFWAKGLILCQHLHYLDLAHFRDGFVPVCKEMISKWPAHKNIFIISSPHINYSKSKVNKLFTSCPGSFSTGPGGVDKCLVE